MSLHIYVASPYSNAPEVRRIHDLLKINGMTPTSSWAEKAQGPENLSVLPRSAKQLITRTNDIDLASSDAVLVVSKPNGGAEMFCELRYAIDLGIPVLYVEGREVLSDSRDGVEICASVVDAFFVLLTMADRAKHSVLQNEAKIALRRQRYERMSA